MLVRMQNALGTTHTLVDFYTIKETPVRIPTQLSTYPLSSLGIQLLDCFLRERKKAYVHTNTTTRGCLQTLNE